VGEKGQASLIGSLLGSAGTAWSQLTRSAGPRQPDPAPQAAVKKPANLVYGVEESPPAQVRWFSAIQQVAISSIYMIYPLILARQAGLGIG